MQGSGGRVMTLRVETRMVILSSQNTAIPSRTPNNKLEAVSCMQSPSSTESLGAAMSALRARYKDKKSPSAVSICI